MRVYARAFGSDEPHSAELLKLASPDYVEDQLKFTGMRERSGAHLRLEPLRGFLPMLLYVEGTKSFFSGVMFLMGYGLSVSSQSRSPVSHSTSERRSFSSYEQKEIATPGIPARPVLPMRCT